MQFWRYDRAQTNTHTHRQTLSSQYCALPIGGAVEKLPRSRIEVGPTALSSYLSLALIPVALIFSPRKTSLEVWRLKVYGENMPTDASDSTAVLGNSVGSKSKVLHRTYIIAYIA